MPINNTLLQNKNPNNLLGLKTPPAPSWQTPAYNTSGQANFSQPKTGLLNLGSPSTSGVLNLGSAPNTGIKLGSPSNAGVIGLGNTSSNNNTGLVNQTMAPSAPAVNYGQNTPAPAYNPAQNNLSAQNIAAYQAGQGTVKGIIGLSDLPKSTPPPTYTPNNQLAGQLTTGLANTAVGENPTTNAATNSLLNKANAPTEDYTNAMRQAQNYNAQIGELNKNYAQQTANIEGSPIDLSLATGEQGILNRLMASKSAALAGQFQGATNLLGAANTQQGLQQGAATSAGGLAQGQQGLAQSGLGTAAGLAQPQPYGITTTPYNPATGQYGTMPGGAGGAATAGAIQAQIGQGGSVQTMVGQQAQAQSLAANLTSLIDSAEINPNNYSVFTSFVNGVNQWLNGQAGDPQYQNFANLINEISSRYASILNQSGGTPTDQSTISHSIINGLASGQDIKTVLNSLDKNATDSIKALSTASQTNAVSNPTTNTASNSTAPGSFFAK